eukprot:6179379-Pleurochrysis_carterae.AAC.2
MIEPRTLGWRQPALSLLQQPEQVLVLRPRGGHLGPARSHELGDRRRRAGRQRRAEALQPDRQSRLQRRQRRKRHLVSQQLEEEHAVRENVGGL